jgi:PAS domain S-box-containing protein
MPEEDTGRPDAVLHAVTFAAERFLTAPSWRACIDDVLARLGEAASASAVYVYENHRPAGGDLLMSARHAWVAPDVRAWIGDLSSGNYPYRSGYSRWERVLGEGGVIRGRVRDFPAEERELLGRDGILAQVAVPIVVGGEWWGFFGIDDCVVERVWTDSEVDALRAAAGILGAAILREATDERLRDAEGQYRSLVEQVPAVIYIDAADEHMTSMYISPQIESLSGYPPADYLGEVSFWVERVHPSDRARFVAETALANETGGPFRLEYRIVARDGRTLWVRDESLLQRAADGRPFWRGVMVDITEQKRVEAALLESEERYRRLVEVSPDAVLVHSDGTFVFANVAAARLLGVADPAVLVGQPFVQFVHPDYHEVVRRRVQQEFDTGAPASLLQEKFVALDGRELDVEVAGISLTYAGRPAGLIIVRDVTERLRIERQLRQAESQFRALVEQLPGIVYMAEFDPAGDWLYVSPQVESILGYTDEEWRDDPTLFDQRLYPEDEPTYRAAEAESQANGTTLMVEYRMIARDGRIVWFHDEAVVIRDEDDRPLFHQGLMFDVTSNKRAEEALREALDREQEAGERLRGLDEMRNTFLHAVSNELRVPLTAVLGFAFTLGQKDLDIGEADRDEILERLAVNARRLERLLGDLLDVERLARGILEPQLFPTNLGDLVRRVVGDNAIGSSVEIQLRGEPIVMSIDGPKVSRILDSLLANVSRHTPAGRRIWVRVEREIQGLLLAVEDDGPGVPDDLKEAIFEPFRSAGDGSSHEAGPGIGLALVARFAELHGGRAWVEDRAGGGASFRVFLPASGQALAS